MSDVTARSRDTPSARQRPSQMLEVDRGALGSGGGQVLIHDHRELKFLKQLSAAGIFAALMSSSGLAYAVSLDFGFTYVAGLFLQTTGAGLLLMAYLRSYVARASLDPRRARLVITSSSLFGEPSLTDQELPLALLEPGATLTDHYIKFRISGSKWNPACWIAYRMPRARADGRDRKPGAQVGYRASVAARTQLSATTTSSASAAPSSVGVSKSRHRFLGAGLGGSDAAAEGMPRGFAAPPSSRLPRVAAEATSRAAPEPAAPEKSLAGLTLHHGLPVNHAEEQKILEFFDDPMAYAAPGLRLA